MSDIDDLREIVHVEMQGGFGKEVLYTPFVGDPQIIEMVERPPVTMDPIEASQFVIRWAPESVFDVPPIEGCTLTVGTTDYTIFEVRRDRFGGVYLFANR